MTIKEEIVILDMTIDNLQILKAQETWLVLSMLVKNSGYKL